MFWKKKAETKSDFETSDYTWTKDDWIPGIRNGLTCKRPTWRGQRLAVDSDYRHLIEKVNLILDHLNLTYVPETEKKEAAKLETKKVDLWAGLKTGSIIKMSDTGDSIGYTTADGRLGIGFDVAEEKPKKKRKYTKSGKYSKKNIKK